MQQEMLEMKEVSEQIHLTSRLQLLGMALVAQFCCHILSTTQYRGIELGWHVLRMMEGCLAELPPGQPGTEE